MWKAQNATLTTRKETKIKKPWITTEMSDKMNERRKCKSRNDEEGRIKYNRLNNELRV